MNKDLQLLLQSENTDQISKGLELAKSKGTRDEIILICKLLEQTNLTSFRNQIIELLSAIKDKKANTELIEAVTLYKDNNSVVQAILQACWQSQLDFSQNLALFTDIFINSNYLTALEAFTLIENIWTDYSFNEEHQSLLIDKIKDEFSTMDETKLILAKELILILES